MAHRGPVLVVNAGSTSAKLSVVDDLGGVAWSHETGAGDDAMTAALADAGARRALDGVVAVGHRIVHGGDRFVAPVVVDDPVLAELDALGDLAPLHNAAGLAGIRTARARLPGVPHVACFDTAFHATMPDAARAFGGPYEWLTAGLRRYGFHGFSHAYAAGRAAHMLRRDEVDLRLVTCHLGGGCSLAAIDGGRSVDTTMGFTPVDGLVMGTRAGSVDAGLLVHLLRHGTTVDALSDLLERRSGLLGLSGVSGDLREVLAARDAGDERAGLAVDVFVHRLVAGIGAMAAVLGGVDAIVFTGGIGEHCAEVRTRAAAACSWLGTTLDDDANRSVAGDADVSAPAARVRVLVVTAREDLAIAAAARRALAST
ncbi:MAG TPA: acetate/propionate family kinase [Acidimicrobiia bacterium]|nr:acetate/propionate family kinase [Acidimicrobiia bacterium]